MGLLALLWGRRTPGANTAGHCWRCTVVLACRRGGIAAGLWRYGQCQPHGLVQGFDSPLVVAVASSRRAATECVVAGARRVLLVVALALRAGGLDAALWQRGASRDDQSLAEGAWLLQPHGAMGQCICTSLASSPGWAGGASLITRIHITPYPGLRFCAILDNAHNLPFAPGGGVGRACGVGCVHVAGLAGLACPAWREQSPWRQMAWAMLTMMALHSLVEYPLWYGQFQLTLALCVAVLLWVPRSAVAGCPAPARLVALRVGALLWLVLVAWVALDYARASQVYIAPEQRMAVGAPTRWRRPRRRCGCFVSR